MTADNLVLGTVKLGIPDYGFSNKNTNRFSTIDFLSYAWNIGIRKFDTSPRYGISEKIIGDFILQKKNIPFISTKIDGLNANNPKIYDVMFESVKKSLSNMNLEIIDLCYLHQNDLKIISDPYIIDAIIKLKDKGLIKSTGVSVYTSEECEYAINNPAYDSIQFPVNIFDVSIYNKYVKNNKTSKKFIARSILLQGLVLNQKNLKLKTKYSNDILNYLLKVNKISNVYQISLIELSLLFVFSLTNIEEYIIGSTSSNNLKKNIEIIEKSLDNNLFNEIFLLACEKKIWSNPQLWN